MPGLLIGPIQAFLLFLLGILAIYCELIWPGRIWAGLLGCALTLTGAYFVWQNSPAVGGVVFLGAAAVLFLIEAFWRIYFLPGILGTASLTIGCCRLFPANTAIPPRLAIPVCVIFGAITVFLAYTAKRARQNKWSDIRSR